MPGEDLASSGPRRSARWKARRLQCTEEVCRLCSWSCQLWSVAAESSERSDVASILKRCCVEHTPSRVLYFIHSKLLSPLLWTGVPTPSAPADRQYPLPIFRCPGNASMLRRVFPDKLMIFATFQLAGYHPANTLGERRALSAAEVFSVAP